MADAPAKPAVIALEGITKAYGVGTPVVTEVLHDIDLTIAPGEFLSIIGPSGSGKSTLLNLLGLLDRPTAGRILIEGKDTTGMDDDTRTHVRGRTLGFVFQFHHLLPAFTALENVMMPMLVDQGRATREARERATRLLEAVGLTDRASYKATEISGGQQQRVAIARALAMSPRLVLADEPTGNLDTETGWEVFELLRRFNREEGTAFILVTHDDEIAERCDRVVELVDGRVRADRPPRPPAIHLREG